MTIKYIIIDLDNCISDDSKRRKYLDDPRFTKDQQLTAYHIRCDKDKFVWGIEEPFPENNIIITGRPEFYLEYTKIWLNKNGINPSGIYMRPYKNHMPSTILKRMFLLMILNFIDVKDIIMAYDDRQDILDIYNLFGIPTTLKRINDYENG